MSDTTDVKKTVWERVTTFLRHDLWEMRSSELPWLYRSGVYLLRMGHLVVDGFRRNACSLHAASLTFFTLMGLVPILVLALALARTFGGADLAKEQLDRHLNAWMSQMEAAVDARTAEIAEGDAEKNQVHEEVTKAFSTQVREIADQLFDQVNSISFGTLGGIGAVMLIWSVVGMLGKVEDSFNRIWGVERSRVLVRKLADYLFVIIILPFLIMVVSSMPIAKMITDAMDKTVGGAVSDGVRMVVNSSLLKSGITLTVGTLTFAFLLGFMPNVRVQTGAALVGGLVTLVLFGGWLKLCAMLQVGIAKYSALYGGFAVLPILLMWVYTSWQIILLGSEIAFAVQNRDTYVLEQNASRASLRSRLLLALTLCAEAAHCAKDPAGGPFAAEAFARRRGISSRFVKDILEDLARHGILAEVAGRPGDYLLARCGSSLTAAEIAKALLDEGEPPEALGLTALSAPLLAFNQRVDERIEEGFGQPVAALNG
ncbi:MAG TPA: YhjD/YihY/BrkB family envelope integrity protein [Kiritimatiellia bacterium]|jgi:membrane protein|nr:YhjD/YihY/BrkB family envelope integrity protein [Kiritimatiellia bacterium]HOR96928.1 YhjD/YihY/BrkB family envelope integrity protein [Kiritimatiellia bacterium]HPC49683.1 YhjD/YihY/BrkB family envelope integrity protein [Kiritimatiellia bacterium]HPK36852.1 YhjD/YihY/BrkB family envelope integrity protein [Kiritimatiellia bacterium]HPW74485.1 YhjD/YihY/BrkB family envelope integrity protein [Kiritimatiellia bacterium]